MHGYVRQRHTHVLGAGRRRLAAGRSRWGGAAGGTGRAGGSERAAADVAAVLMIVGVTTTPLASLGDGQLEPLGAELSPCIGRVCRCVDAPLLRTHEGREPVVVRRAGLGGVASPGAAVTAPFPRAADRTHRESVTARTQEWAISHGWRAALWWHLIWRRDGVDRCSCASGTSSTRRCLPD